MKQAIRDELAAAISAAEAKAEEAAARLQDAVEKDVKALEKKLKRVQSAQDEAKSTMMPGSYSF